MNICQEINMGTKLDIHPNNIGIIEGHIPRPNIQNNLVIKE